MYAPWLLDLANIRTHKIGMFQAKHIGRFTRLLKLCLPGGISEVRHRHRY